MFVCVHILFPVAPSFVLFYIFLISTYKCSSCICVCLRLYVPEFASSLSVSLADCSSGEGVDGGNCSLALRLGSASLQHGPVTVNCSGIGCSAALSNPPWHTWLRVVVESSQVNRTVTFSIVSNYTGEYRHTATCLKHKFHTLYALIHYLCVYFFCSAFVCVCLSGM